MTVGTRGTGPHSQSGGEGGEPAHGTDVPAPPAACPGVRGKGTGEAGSGHRLSPGEFFKNV